MSKIRKTFKNERNLILVQNNIRKIHKKSPIKENSILVKTKQRKMRKTFKNERYLILVQNNIRKHIKSRQ